MSEPKVIRYPSNATEQLGDLIRSVEYFIYHSDRLMAGDDGLALEHDTDRHRIVTILRADLALREAVQKAKDFLS